MNDTIKELNEKLKQIDGDYFAAETQPEIFTLWNQYQEITEGDIFHITERIKQILHENGYFE